MQIQIKTAFSLLTANLNKWQKSTFDKMKKRKMKAVGKYLFIAKIIKKCLDALKKHSKCE
jgi:hypothetical protein